MRLFPVAAAALLASTTVLATATSASASADSGCQRAGLSTLRSLGLLDDVAKDGLPIALAAGAGVTVRPGADISGAPDPIPLRTLLADHRAGENSLFVYPWC